MGNKFTVLSIIVSIFVSTSAFAAKNLDSECQNVDSEINKIGSMCFVHEMLKDVKVATKADNDEDIFQNVCGILNNWADTDGLSSYVAGNFWRKSDVSQKQNFSGAFTSVLAGAIKKFLVPEAQNIFNVYRAREWSGEKPGYDVFLKIIDAKDKKSVKKLTFKVVVTETGTYLLSDFEKGIFSLKGYYRAFFEVDNWLGSDSLNDFAKVAKEEAPYLCDI